VLASAKVHAAFVLFKVVIAGDISDRCRLVVWWSGPLDIPAPAEEFELKILRLHKRFIEPSAKCIFDSVEKVPVNNIPVRLFHSFSKKLNPHRYSLDLVV
jgi:hypothetical protein